MLKKLFRKIFYKPVSRPLPAYRYTFRAVDYNNAVECVLTAECSITCSSYREALIVPGDLRLFQRSRSRILIVKRALCELMNNRLGVKVEAPSA